MEKEPVKNRWESLVEGIKIYWPQLPDQKLETTGGDFRDIEKLIAQYSKESPDHIRKTLGAIFEDTQKGRKTTLDDFSDLEDKKH